MTYEHAAVHTSVDVAAVHGKRNSCRACSYEVPERFLELGPSPLANAFLADPAEFDGECKYPLDVYFCPKCSLVQLLDVINPEVLFRHYLYVSGTSDTIRRHYCEYAETLSHLLSLSQSDLVTEVASNDGSLLGQFRDRGIPVLGIEPATNIAAMARAAGIPTVNRFFNAEAAREIRRGYGVSKLVIGNNVLAHVDDPRDFLAGAEYLLAPGGMVVFEFPYLSHLIENLEYDTIYHEHLCYFSARAVLHLCDAVGLSIVRVDRVAVHGGSLRIYACRKHDHPQHDETLLALAAKEREAGLDRIETYARFAGDVRENRRLLRNMLQELRSAGHTVAAYGAPAKGNTLLNYCDISQDLVAYTVDKSPLKVNLYSPGVHLPVLDVSTLLEQQPDYVLILAWNFASEIIEQQSEYHRRGGRFIIPVPNPRIV